MGVHEKEGVESRVVYRVVRQSLTGTVLTFVYTVISASIMCLENRMRKKLKSDNDPQRNSYNGVTGRAQGVCLDFKST